MNAAEYQQALTALKLHAHSYYGNDAPGISDTTYDTLYKAIQHFEKNHPLLIDPLSPTQTIGTSPDTRFTPFTHRIPLKSLSNAHTYDDCQAFYKRITSQGTSPAPEITVEPKIDGLAVAIHYKKGHLDIAATRGNGTTGECVTHTIETICSLPKQLKQPLDIEVRGEVFMGHTEFKDVAHTFSNPRNAAAGSIRQLNAAIAKKRRLSIFIYAGFYHGISTHEAMIAFLKDLGFPTIPKLKCCDSLDKAWEHTQAILAQRSTFPFDIDGVVMKANSLALQHTLGSTAKSPRWAIAYKFAAEEKETQLENISFQVGRTGTITPVAHLTPVTVGGARISRASLHNADEISRLALCIGDYVSVKRAGDVIPKIVGVIKKGKERKTIHFPTHCPACNHRLIQAAGETAIKCTSMSCIAQIKERIKHFVSRNAMNIDGLGEARIDQLISKGYIHSVADLYTLSQSRLLELDGYGIKAADKLLIAIEKSKHCTLSSFIFALAIPHVGLVSAQVLAQHFSTIEALLVASEQELAAIASIGPIVAASIQTYCQSTDCQDMISQLLVQGVTPSHKSSKPTGALVGDCVVITGKLPVSRDHMVAAIKKSGGKSSSTVSKECSILVIGENPGSKLAKARRLIEKGQSISIMSYDAFSARLDVNSTPPN